ncbi:DUF5819 family protein [Leucobacter luti]
MTGEKMRSPNSREVSRPIWLRILAAFISASAVLHISASFLWIAPYSEGARSLFPGGQEGLSAYMLPFFGQSWSVFAPDPINGDYSLQVRAVLDEEGTVRTTEWVNATNAEMGMLTYNLLPPRAAIQSVELSSRFAGAWQALSDDHRVVVGLGYYEGNDWMQRLEHKLRSYGGEDAIKDYLARERQVTQYATQVAQAVWGEDVVAIQFEVKRQNVLPFKQRADHEASLPPVSTFSTGWRGQLVANGQSSKDFAEVFLPLYEQSLTRADGLRK